MVLSRVVETVPLPDGGVACLGYYGDVDRYMGTVHAADGRFVVGTGGYIDLDDAHDMFRAFVSGFTY